MDHHGSDSRSHPSDQIHDAAYPNDAPYIPGQQRPYQPYTSSTSSNISPITQTNTNDSYSSRPTNLAPNNWSGAYPEPTEPPPPYVPSRPGTGNSYTNVSLHQQHSLTPLSPNHSDSHALLPLNSPYGQPFSSSSTLQNPSDAGRIHPYVQYPQSPMAGKLGPMAADRRRRKKRLLLYVIALAVMVVFLISLVAGLILGMSKNKNNPPPN